MTEEIKNRIDGYLQAQKSHVSSEGLENIRTDIQYGYSLASEQLAAAEARISELQAELLCERSAIELKNNRIKELEALVSELSKTVYRTIQNGLDKQTNY